MVVDLPARTDQVLRRSALDEEPTGVVVQPEAHPVTGEAIDMETDRVRSEAVPVHEPLRLDDDVPQVDGPEHVRAHSWHPGPPWRKSLTSDANSSGCSYWNQCPTPAAR